jgi:hypothetical protein
LLVSWVDLSTPAETRFGLAPGDRQWHSSEISAGPLRALDAAGAQPIELALPMLLTELAASTVGHVLVLDDYQVLSDPKIHEAVEFLIAYLPSWRKSR